MGVKWVHTNYTQNSTKRGSWRHRDIRCVLGLCVNRLLPFRPLLLLSLSDVWNRVTWDQPSRRLCMGVVYLQMSTRKPKRATLQIEINYQLGSMHIYIYTTPSRRWHSQLNANNVSSLCLFDLRECLTNNFPHPVKRVWYMCCVCGGHKMEDIRWWWYSSTRCWGISGGGYVSSECVCVTWCAKQRWTSASWTTNYE